MSDDISVPIQMFIDAQQHKYARKLQFFLSLKLIYRNGKTKLLDDELLFIEMTEEIRSRKTTLKYLVFFLKRGWLQYNKKTGFYIIKSFNRIRVEMNWTSRLAFAVDFGSYKNTKAITGAIVFA